MTTSPDPPTSSATAPSIPQSLQDARVPTLPPSAYYIPNFITEQEELLILDKIANAPKPRWKQLTHRRLQTWPSDLVKNALLDEPLPQWLIDPVISRLLSLSYGTDDSGAKTNLFSKSPHKQPNHVLVNEYPPGVGIMPHKLTYHPVVCTVSLGSSLCLNLYQSKEDGALNPDPVYRILQEPRSLLITTDDIYTEYLHGIANTREDIDLSARTVANWNLLGCKNLFEAGRNERQTRISLTYRDVLKVVKLGSRLNSILGRR
ncbi:hypothetical protein jhhlp_002013 [Lomentospora prolificans]|uniref:Alpha-ketoglutarate-dependent dioxygenase AlkB-like domain-containing protein n=1 Tax=Lomentospora prolificans TaxID=41688 RepID=A0A2N3NCX2_9PEZI|nr:hypothetical protein jhhlp_002013 [Lomentospora prolificans]